MTYKITPSPFPTVNDTTHSEVVSNTYATKKPAPPPSLSDKYEYNLERPGLFCNNEDFIELRKTVEAIDELIGPENSDVIETVRNTLLIMDHRRKMSELGMILFYLDRDKILPVTDSLVFYRAQEIHEEVQHRILQHKEAQVSKLVPTGKTHYILSALSNMVITSNQKFNKGGVLAIKKILCDPEMFLSKYLQAEHRQHLLTIADNILNDSALQEIIEIKTTAHKDLENLIRLDLKLHPEQEVKSCHIMHDILTALFSDIRQKDNPNCYAIAALIYTSENYTLRFIERTLHWLEHGHITISGHYTHPLKPLVNKRLMEFQDLSYDLDNERAFNTAPIQHIKTIHTESKNLYYSTYKFNTLNVLHMTAIELSYTNEGLGTQDSYTKISVQKIELIEACINAIRQATSRRNSNCPPEFLNTLRKKLTGSIWLENCNKEKVVVIGQKVISPTRTIERFEGNTATLSQVFQNSTRVLSSDGKTHHPISRVTDLQRILSKTVKETAGSTKSMTDAIANDHFRVIITNYCSRQIGKSGIKGMNLNRADLFLLKQEGGFPHIALKLVYKINLLEVRIKNNSTPYKLMKNLVKTIPTIDSAIRSSPKVIVFAPAHHTWTLNPYLWRTLSANQTGFYNFIQQTVFNPAKRKLCSTIDENVIHRVINAFEKTPLDKRRIKKEFLGKKMTYGMFRDRLLEFPNILSDSHPNEMINIFFSEIHLTRHTLTRTLNKLGITIPSEIFHQIYNSLPKEGTQPYIMARKLRQKLINEKITIKHPYDIERALCQVKEQPMSFIIGDYNWLQENTEDPYHIELCIGYNWVKNNLEIRKRFKYHERIEDEKKYTIIGIQHHSFGKS